MKQPDDEELPGGLERSGLRQAMRLWHLTTTTIVQIAVASLVGYGVDTYVGTLPLFLIIGLFSGFGLGCYYFWLGWKSIQRDNANHKSSGKE